MAHTYTFRNYRDVWGSRFVRKISITIVDNYVTGGWRITPRGVGFWRTALLQEPILTKPAAPAGYVSLDDVKKKGLPPGLAGAERAGTAAPASIKICTTSAWFSIAAHISAV